MKSDYIDVPALQQKAYNKTLRKYQGTQSAIIATPYKILTRAQITERKNRQWMTEIADAWKLLDAMTKSAWKDYALNIGRNGWQLYMQEYAYRKKYDLSLPPEPHELHQMYGLMLSNPIGVMDIQAQRFDISVTGPISIIFNYKKIERAETTDLPFTVTAEAVYFEQGENKSEVYTFEADPGSSDWSTVQIDFGDEERYYFELIITIQLKGYNADVVIDNFQIIDYNGQVVFEPWHIKAGKEWIYQVRTRKMGWDFNQVLGPPYIQIVYTGV